VILAARQHCEIALASDPGFGADADNNYAIALEQLRRLDGAQAHFERALQLAPNYADARKNLAPLNAMRANPPTPSPR
jgi:Flp pilus assembly protein TadD